MAHEGGKTRARLCEQRHGNQASAAQGEAPASEQHAPILLCQGLTEDDVRRVEDALAKEHHVAHHASALCVGPASAGAGYDDGAHGHPGSPARGQDDARGLLAGRLLEPSQNCQASSEDWQCRLPSAAHCGVFILEAQEKGGLGAREAEAAEQNPEKVAAVRQAPPVQRSRQRQEGRPCPHLPHRLEDQRAGPVDPKLGEEGAAAEQSEDKDEGQVDREVGMQFPLLFFDGEVCILQGPIASLGSHRHCCLHEWRVSGCVH
mmetsp:Transcript_42963/g.119581  ORF Transcript_42963/g.119581 Transcript_42963/m.119581 type:complete len:261 (-) Transcript_42963:90-872(-)